MPQDWLYVLPDGNNLDEQEEVLTRWLAEDPVAAAIGDEEAEAFVAACETVRELDPAWSVRLWKVCGVPFSRSTEKIRRRATRLIFRRWNDPHIRQVVLGLAASCRAGVFPSPALMGHLWTDDMFVRAFVARHNVAWLTWVRRYVGRGEGVTEWLESLPEWAQRHYRLWLGVGRITMRRLLGPDRQAGAAGPQAESALRQVAAAVQPELAEQVRSKDRLSAAMRSNVRRMQQCRKQLKAQARRAEAEARATLSTAKGEVAAARRALQEQLAAQERELREQARRSEAELAAIRMQIEGARSAFVKELAAIPVPRGIGVDDPPSLPDPARCAALERDRRDRALQQIHIRCDGLYRRKGDRPGIAVSGFDVRLGPDHWHGEDGRLTCCGASAGSMVAEYGAVLMALCWLDRAGPPPGAAIEIWSDCKNMVREVTGATRSKAPRGCVTISQAVKRLLRRLAQRGCQVRLRWVPRDQVHEVDRLCDRAYREIDWYHRRQGPWRTVPLMRFLHDLERK